MDRRTVIRGPSPGGGGGYSRGGENREGRGTVIRGSGGGTAVQNRAERVEGSKGEGLVLPPGGGGGYSRGGEGKRGGPLAHRELSHSLWPREAAREPLDGCSLNDLTCRQHAHTQWDVELD